jgi:methionyl-tRNA formyltransferase
MEWALLNCDATGITTFFVDEGIDTGPVIVIRREIDVSAHRDVATATRYLFSLDGEMFAQALRLLSGEDFIPLRHEVDAGNVGTSCLGCSPAS